MTCLTPSLEGISLEPRAVGDGRIGATPDLGDRFSELGLGGKAGAEGAHHRHRKNNCFHGRSPSSCVGCATQVKLQQERHPQTAFLFNV
jgi:hypothetical protein